MGEDNISDVVIVIYKDGSFIYIYINICIRKTHLYIIQD